MNKPLIRCIANGAFVAGIASAVTGCFLVAVWLGCIVLGAAFCAAATGAYLATKEPAGA